MMADCHPDWLLFEEDESWFHRFRQPTLRTWTDVAHPQKLIERTIPKATTDNRKILVLIWDNAPWHTSKRIREWIHLYNQAAKAAGDVRLVSQKESMAQLTMIHGRTLIASPHIQLR